MVIAARYMATCLAASWSQSAIRVRQCGSVKPRCSMFAGPPGPGPMSPNSSPAGRLWARTSNRAEMAYAGAGSKPRTSASSAGPADAGARRWSSGPRAWSSGSRASANRCSRSWASSRSASAIAVSTLAEGRAGRPCSSHVYQVKPTLASWATSSRRRPGTRRTPQSGSPTSAGRSRARRERRNAPSSRRRSLTAPRAGRSGHTDDMNTLSSRDGTTIAYDEQGEGPALILVDGALTVHSSGSGSELAKLLAPHFTVFGFDRRGRGESGDTLPYAVDREIDDIEALIDRAGGPAFLYGHSSGGPLAMRAAIRLGSQVSKIALYEPPYNNDPGVQESWSQYLSQLRQALAEHRRGDAVALFLRFVGTPAEQVEGTRRAPFWP